MKAVREVMGSIISAKGSHRDASKSAYARSPATTTAAIGFASIASLDEGNGMVGAKGLKEAPGSPEPSAEDTEVDEAASWPPAAALPGDEGVAAGAPADDAAADAAEEDAAGDDDDDADDDDDDVDDGGDDGGDGEDGMGGEPESGSPEPDEESEEEEDEEEAGEVEVSCGTLGTIPSERSTALATKRITVGAGGSMPMSATKSTSKGSGPSVRNREVLRGKSLWKIE
jgi:hypothetical protein